MTLDILKSVALLTILGVAHSASVANYKNDQHHGSGHHKSIPSWIGKIKNVVVLVEENRSYDNIMGGLNYSPDLDGLVNRLACNPVNASDPHSNVVCALPIAKDVVPDDPNHGIPGTNMELFGLYHPDEKAVDAGKVKNKLNGFLTEQLASYPTINVTRASEVLNFYTPKHVPVISTLAEQYALFVRWFAAIPGPTNCNRAYITSGTSHGVGDDSNFGVGDVPPLPQKSIFEQLSEKGIDWINYSNRTFPDAPDAAFYNWTLTTGKNVTNIKPIADFFRDAKNGDLPPLSYINPECCKYNSYHPAGPVSGGEEFVRLIYEALRKGPQWPHTLFILTYDEHGGFYDHVPPPDGVPPGDDLVWTQLAPDGKNITFDFRRLGVRVPTIMMSPWIKKGTILKKGKNYGGEYTHTSIPHTLAHFWDLDILTKRIGYSSTFEEIISDHFRDDTPLELPAAKPF